MKTGNNSYRNTTCSNNNNNNNKKQHFLHRDTKAFAFRPTIFEPKLNVFRLQFGEFLPVRHPIKFFSIFEDQIVTRMSIEGKPLLQPGNFGDRVNESPVSFAAFLGNTRWPQSAGKRGYLSEKKRMVREAKRKVKRFLKVTEALFIKEKNSFF